MNEFFHMGGYAFYVWTSYGLTFLVLIINLIIPFNQERTILRTLNRKLRRKQRERHPSRPKA
ncbi:heme exporter protein CcmD [Candidatus Halobeggiatoa sp. HSG11]|nr:heme exporter protein CcmD [Candidatus Halobeggiatoa sp. HSG11]